MKATINFNNIKNYSIDFYSLNTLEDLKALENVAPGSLGIADGATYIYNNDLEWQFLFNNSNSNLDKYKYSYTKLKTIKDYLSEVYYDEIDYDGAKEYFKTHTPGVEPGACSSVRKGDYYGRNFDWIYSNLQSYVIKVAEKEDRFGSIGMAGLMDNLTKDVAESLERHEDYQYLPFVTLDGLNSQGVFINLNVVPYETDTEYKQFATAIVEPLEDEREELCSTMVVRYVLDHFATAHEAIDFLCNHVKIYFPQRRIEQHYVGHWMIGDANGTYVLEPIDGHLRVIENPKAMFNFYLTDVQYNEDGTLNTMEERTENPELSNNNITPHGAGIERHNVVMRDYSEINDVNKMLMVMNNLQYTNAYKESTSPFWYGEFVDGDNTINTKIDNEDFMTIVMMSQFAYENRVREPEDESGIYGSWQTAHSSVYDLNNKKMYVRVQEEMNDIKEYDFSMNYSHEEAVSRDNDIFNNLEG